MKNFFIFVFIGLTSFTGFAQKVSNNFESSLRQNPLVESFEMNKTLGTPSFIRFKAQNLPDATSAEALIKDLFQFQKSGAQ